jgi:hypothetical protein
VGEGEFGGGRKSEWESCQSVASIYACVLAVVPCVRILWIHFMPQLINFKFNENRLAANGVGAGGGLAVAVERFSIKQWFNMEIRVGTNGGSWEVRQVPMLDFSSLII